MAGRGRRVARWTGGVVLVILVGLTGAVIWLTQSDGGRERVVRSIVNAANSAFDGRGELRIGSLRSANPRSLDLRDVQLVDTLGEPILSVGRVGGRLAVSDLLDGVVRIAFLELDSVRLDLRADLTGPFNLQWLLLGDPNAPPAPARAARLGDDVRIDSLVLRDGEMVVTLPWEPHPLFEGAERDSVTAVRDSLHTLISIPGGLLEQRTISIRKLVAHDVLAITADDAPGRLVLDSADLTVSDPPVVVRDVQGDVVWYNDSLTFDAGRVLLPDSRLSAAGMIAWGQDGPVRYDVRIDAPDVALADINWTWPVMPMSGRASAKVRLRTLDNPDHLEVVLKELEARAMESQITGEVSMIAEVKDFILRDVALSFEPMSTALAARLTEDLLPPELDGRITGRFVAREGGSLTALRIDTLRMAFDDANIPGARSRVRASGVVAVGVNPTARDLRVTDLLIDLRTVRTVVPDLPELVNGTVSGTGRIASASLNAADARDLTLQWTDNQGHVSTVTGRSAVGWGGRTTTADVALAFDPVDLAAFARFDTAFVARGALRGTIQGSGSLDSMPFVASLTHVDPGAGTLRASGWFGVQTTRDTVVNWRTIVLLEADSLNARPWVLEGMAPVTRIAGTMRVASRGVNAVVDTAEVSADLTQSAAENRTPIEFFTHATWGRDALLVDSLLAIMPGTRLEASGGLARDSGGRESFRGSLRMDSLSQVRAELPRLAGMLAQMDTSLAASVRQFAADTLLGDVNASVYGEGSFADYLTSVAVAGNQVQVGSIVVGRLFGSVRADNMPGAVTFVAAATADSVEGIGAVRIATANFGIDSASSSSGALRFDLLARDTSRLRMRGRFARGGDTLLVRSDSVRFTYADVVWTNPLPLVLRDHPSGFTIDSFALLSNQNGSLTLGAQVPLDAAINGYLTLDQFPVGELAAFALGTTALPGLVSGSARLTGVRQDPQLMAAFTADSLGPPGVTISGVRLDANYDAQQLNASVSVLDTTGRALRAQIQLPADLRLQSVVGERLYTERLEGSVVADSLRLRDLPLRVADVRDIDGVLNGRIVLGGTFESPSFDGSMLLTEGTLYSDVLGIRPRGARLDFLAGGDSLRVQQFRFQSGPRAADSLSLTATVRRPLRDDPRVSLNAYLNNVQLARQSNGTDLDLSGRINVGGRFSRPIVSADLFVPRANLVLELTEARTVLDLNSAEAQALLSEDEMPTVLTAGEQFTSLGEYLEARDVRVRLGNDVWVRTAEASVKLAGDVTVLEAVGQQLSLDGELLADRGTYRLDLGVVNRPFEVDSGRVRFFPQNGLNPALDIHASHTVRGVNGRDVAIDVAIKGTLEDPTLELSTDDDAYAQAPESEFISLLVFGAPTFALDGQRQQTVAAVTGVLLPALSGAVEGTLQRLLPVFNTVQVNTAGNSSGGQLEARSLIDNLSVTAGTQIGNRTYLRLDTGVCSNAAGAGAERGLNLWYGVAVEYRIAQGLTAQVGVDPGPSPCGAQIGVGAARRMQVGFDLFKEWVF